MRGSRGSPPLPEAPLVISRRPNNGRSNMLTVAGAIVLALIFSGRLSVGGLSFQGFTASNPFSPTVSTAKPKPKAANPINKPPPVVNPTTVGAKSLRNYGYIKLSSNWGNRITANQPQAAPYIAMIDKACSDSIANLDPRLLAALVYRESNYNQTNAVARSRDGKPMTISFSSNGSLGHAIGLTQLLQSTADNLHVDPYDNYQNLLGGARFLRGLINQYNNGLWNALSAYNGGTPSNAAPGYADFIIQWYKTYGGTVY